MGRGEGNPPQNVVAALNAMRMGPPNVAFCSVVETA
jgi:hypothetical protein